MCYNRFQNVKPLTRLFSAMTIRYTGCLAQQRKLNSDLLKFTLRVCSDRDTGVPICYICKFIPVTEIENLSLMRRDYYVAMINNSRYILPRMAVMLTWVNICSRMNFR